MRLRTHAGFRLFWTASTVSDFGTPITTLAIQVLVVTTLSGSAVDVGLVNAARWLPYLLFGVLVGALADRARRKPLLVGSDLGRAGLLCAVPLLAWPGLLSLPTLAALVAVFGLLSLVNDAAHQSFLPRLLPRDALTRANARLAQGSAAADTAGPAIAGGLVGWLGAPAAVLVDAGTYLASGLLIARVRIVDPPAPARAPLGREIREGLAWVYGHRLLRPLSLCTHGWFVFYATLGAVYVPYGLLHLGFGAFGLGLTLALAGVGGLVGAGLSERAGRAGADDPARLAAAGRRHRDHRGHPDRQPRGRRARQPGQRLRARTVEPAGAGVPAGDHPGPAAGPDERDDALHQPGRGGGRRAAGRAGRRLRRLPSGAVAVRRRRRGGRSHAARQPVPYRPLTTRREHMSEIENPVEMGRAIIDGHWYMTLATADASGKPWASPVWFAHDGYREFLWISKPEARHSVNLAVRPQLGIVIFDSTVGMGGAQAVYVDAEASELHGADRDRALAVYSRRSVEFGERELTLADVTAPAPHRLFRAVPSEQFVLDATDRRIPVALG